MSQTCLRDARSLAGFPSWLEIRCRLPGLWPLIFPSQRRGRHIGIAAAVAARVVGWVLLYFCCHAIAHCAVGRILGIRFAFYTVGGTGNPEGWPAGLRWLFEHLPFFWSADGEGLDAKGHPNCQSDHVVCGSDFFRGCPKPGCVLGLALGCPGEQAVSSVCAVLGGWNVSQQLDKPRGRLCQSPAGARQYRILGP